MEERRHIDRVWMIEQADNRVWEILVKLRDLFQGIVGKIRRKELSSAVCI